MATSDSDDFESADEEIEFRGASMRSSGPQKTPKRMRSFVDSDSGDDDQCDSDSETKTWDFNPPSGRTAVRGGKTWSEELKESEDSKKSTQSVLNPSNDTKSTKSTVSSADSDNLTSKKGNETAKNEGITQKKSDLLSKGMVLVDIVDLSLGKGSKEESKKSTQNVLNPSNASKSTKSTVSSADSDNLTTKKGHKTDKNEGITQKKSDLPSKEMVLVDTVDLLVVKGSKDVSSRHQRPERQRKEKPSKPVGLGAKKLGAKIPEEVPRPPPEDIFTPEDIRKRAIEAGKEPPVIQECWEFDEDEATKILQKESQVKNSWVKKSKDSPDFDDVPEELKSNKSFKEVFQAGGDGWETFGDVKEVLGKVEKVEEKVEAKKVLEKLVDEGEDAGGWGGWGSWGSSLLNSASAGVSTLTSHVSQGLSMLEESMGVPDPEELVGKPGGDDSKVPEEKTPKTEENQSQSGFGLGSWMSGVTKLVESTGTKVITGGLGTLETIGKKTMEVLQEGDPGLKKKRAFFKNEIEKPILSQILREAKEKAETGEKSIEDNQPTKTFEIHFDDSQGLVHLEALEMLSKQISIKIEHKLVTLDSDEMISVQETLEEVKELCDLGEEDEDDEEGDLEEKLKSAGEDLGVGITYDGLKEIREQTEKYLSDVSTPDSTVTDKEVFQNAISTLARFTAYSVERFHKTAELLLVKERRSTVNEADALVQLTKILSGQISTTANSFSKCLNERNKNDEGKPKESNDITTIFLEATNASSYIQEAFRLLIPILQVGAL